MAGFWYVDRAGARQGPVEQTELARLARLGTVTADTLVWSDGMADWVRADSLESLRSALAAAPPPTVTPPPPAPLGQRSPSGATQPVASGALHVTYSTWDLFGRLLLLVVGEPFIIPAPWVNTIYWKYLTEGITLPDGRRLAFDGQPLDIWWVFVLQAILIWVGQYHYAGFFTTLVSFGLSFIIVKWVCGSTRLVTSDKHFSFQGDFWPYAGWLVLAMLSFITIIGWAWVFAAYMRWICRHVSGEVRFEFTGTGWEILWRTLAFTIGCCFILPIPWLLVWLMRWGVSQVAVDRHMMPGSV
jgi:hypothetical protein